MGTAPMMLDFHELLSRLVRVEQESRRDHEILVTKIALLKAPHEDAATAAKRRAELEDLGKAVRDQQEKLAALTKACDEVESRRIEAESAAALAKEELTRTKGLAQDARKNLDALRERLQRC